MLPWFLCAASVLGQSKGVFCWFQILMWGRHHGCDLYIKGGYLKFSVSKVSSLSGLLILQLQRYPRHLFYSHNYIIGKGLCRNFTYDFIFSTWFIWHSANSARPRQMTQRLLMQPQTSPDFLCQMAKRMRVMQTRFCMLSTHCSTTDCTQKRLNTSAHYSSHNLKLIC